MNDFSFGLMGVQAKMFQYVENPTSTLVWWCKIINNADFMAHNSAWTYFKIISHNPFFSGQHFQFSRLWTEENWFSILLTLSMLF